MIIWKTADLCSERPSRVIILMTMWNWNRMLRRLFLRHLFLNLVVILFLAVIILTDVLDDAFSSPSWPTCYRNEKRDKTSEEGQPVVWQEHPSSGSTFPLKIVQPQSKRKKKDMEFVPISERNQTIHEWPWAGNTELFTECRKKYRTSVSSMPNVSIIISFYQNENLFNIIHTLHAIVKHTPSQLLHEIILIDDYTNRDDFQRILSLHIDVFVDANVRLFRTDVPLGLIQARLYGIRLAESSVVVVMDSHMEPQPGWLEALLHEIKRDRKTLATPYLDWIWKVDNGWLYRHGSSFWKTYLDWRLVFGFHALPLEAMQGREDDLTSPIRSAVTVGTWAMDKAWYKEIGELDEGMHLWGGENVDLSVRVWLFGGQVVNVPCSHVAHLETSGSREYRRYKYLISETNYKRFAEVWMDDYKEYFYLYTPRAKNLGIGDISSRLMLKSRALHNFSWFHANIMPELGTPGKDNAAWGGLEVLHSESQRLCLDSTHTHIPRMAPCRDEAIQTQGYYWTRQGLIRRPLHVLILESGMVFNQQYTLFNDTGYNSVWHHIRNGPIKDTASGLCLEMTSQLTVITTRCHDTANQRWRFKYYSDRYVKLTSSHLSHWTGRRETGYAPTPYRTSSVVHNKKGTPRFPSTKDSEKKNSYIQTSSKPGF